MSELIARALAACLLAFVAGSACAKPPVWTVHKGRATVVLFGSVHLLPAGVDWRPAALDAALAKADSLWFELPITDATNSETALLALNRGLAAKGDTLSSHLARSDNDRLTRIAAELAFPLDRLEAMRPWLAELMLSVMFYARQGAIASQGVEYQIQGAAPAGAVRHAFETPAFQIDMLAGAAEDDQVAALNETLKEISDDPDSYQRLVREWMDGDLAGLSADALAPLEKASPQAYRRLITVRNQNWADTIARVLRRPGVTVVVVGMGHLIGPGGVPALLRAKGFAVAGPEAVGEASGARADQRASSSR